MSFKEYSQEEIEEKRKQVIEKQEQMFLDSVYNLFQNFDLAIGKGNHSEISNYIIILSSLFKLIEDNKWLNLYENLDEKLKNNIAYRTFKNKKEAMMELIGKNSDFKLKKTDNKSKGGKIKGGGFLVTVIIGIAVASSLIDSISSMGGFKADALYKENIVVYENENVCKNFIYSLLNYGGSCAVNSMLASSNHEDALDTMETQHTPSMQAERIVNISKNQRGYTRQNFKGKEHGTIYPFNMDMHFKYWKNITNSLTRRAKVIHENWQNSVNSTEGDIGIITIGIASIHGNHAVNMISRSVGGTIKIGLIDSNKYSDMLAVKKDAKGNSVCVLGPAYDGGFIYAEKDFFTMDEMYHIGFNNVITKNPIENFFKTLPFGENVTARDILALKYYESDHVPTSSRFPIMDFGITNIMRFIELKEYTSKLTNWFFDIFKKHPNAVPSDIVWDDTLGNYTYHQPVMPGGKTKRFKRKNKKSKRNKK